MHELLHAVYIDGNVRMYQISNNSSPVFLSLYGTFDMNDQKIVHDLNEIIKSQRAFFQDYEFPYYAISLIEEKDLGSMGGTRLHNSFLAYLPQNMEQSNYYILFAHEHLHNWIGGKIRNNTQEELNYWWTEGFTDYYSRVIALRSGEILIDDFILECNEFLKNYYLSPVINEPNIRIAQDFWKDYDVEKLPYYRGFVFAIYLNDLIKKHDATKNQSRKTF